MNKRDITRLLYQLKKSIDFKCSRMNSYAKAGAGQNIESDLNWTFGQGIIGFGFLKNSDSQSYTLSVYIDEQADNTELDSLIPDEITLSDNDRIPVQVMPILLPSLQGNQTRIRPFGPGASISHIFHNRGTLCAKVQSNMVSFQEEMFLLSCHHVLYPLDNRERVICQPAREYIYRDVVSSDIVARGLGGRHARFSAYASNTVDAGIAELKTAEVRQLTNKVLNSSYRITSIANDVEAGMKVCMIGAVSGEKYGYIEDPNFTGVFNYKSTESRKQQVNFHDVVKCNYFSKNGDSGAPVMLAGTNKLLGMHFAGGGGYGYFCKAANIFRALGIRLPL